MTVIAPRPRVLWPITRVVASAVFLAAIVPVFMWLGWLSYQFGQAIAPHDASTFPFVAAEAFTGGCLGYLVVCLVLMDIRSRSGSPLLPAGVLITATVISAGCVLALFLLAWATSFGTPPSTPREHAVELEAGRAPFLPMLLATAQTVVGTVFRVRSRPRVAPPLAVSILVAIDVVALLWISVHVWLTVFAG